MQQSHASICPAACLPLSGASSHGRWMETGRDLGAERRHGADLGERGWGGGGGRRMWASEEPLRFPCTWLGFTHLRYTWAPLWALRAHYRKTEQNTDNHSQRHKMSKEPQTQLFLLSKDTRRLTLTCEETLKAVIGAFSCSLSHYFMLFIIPPQKWPDQPLH